MKAQHKKHNAVIIAISCAKFIENVKCIQKLVLMLSFIHFQNTLFERKVAQLETWHNLCSSLTISSAVEDKLYAGIWSQTHIGILQWNSVGFGITTK